MSNTLTEIATVLSTPKKIKKTATDKTKTIEQVTPIPKVQLIYAFNGTGKTRLSRAFKQLLAPTITKSEIEKGANEFDLSNKKFLYYNAFTEDLFYWDNDLEGDGEPKLKIQDNSFTDWILQSQGQDFNIITNFQKYSGKYLTPKFNAEYKKNELVIKAFSEVTFSLEAGDDTKTGNIKISKGEESNFIWSIFFTLINQVITILNESDPTQRETNQFDQLEFIFIDDPVCSLDENHLIELAVNLAAQIKLSQSQLKFVITTHSTLFYNILYGELNNKQCYMLEKLEDGKFDLIQKDGDSNRSFSYHLHLIQTIEKAISENKIEKFHFTLLRNLYEKTASFLGYPKWSDLLPGDKKLYLNRITQFTSHQTLPNETFAEPNAEEKKIVKYLLNNLKDNYSFWKSEDAQSNPT